MKRIFLSLLLIEAEQGGTIHIICEVTDKGSPALTRYQRFIITVEK